MLDIESVRSEQKTKDSDIELTADLNLASVVDMIGKIYNKRRIVVIDRRSDDVLCRIDSGESDYAPGIEEQSRQMKMEDVKWSSEEANITKVYVQQKQDIQVIDVTRK